MHIILSSIKNLLLIMLFLSISINSQELSKEKREILELKDSRTLGNENALLKMLNSGNNDNIYAVVLALANIADSNTIEALGNKLDAADSPSLQDLIAFALGQMNTPAGNEYIINLLIKYSGNIQSPELLNSLGKTGNEIELNSILYIKTDNNLINSYLAMAIARLGIRKIKNDKAYIKLAELMELSADSTLRKNIAYAFNRTADKQTLLAYNTELVTLSQSPEPYSRMWGFSAIAKQLDTSENSINYLLHSLEKEIDWRARVNICSGLGNYKFDLNSPGLDKVTSALLNHAVNDPSTHVSIVAWQALGKLFAGIDTRNPLARKIQQDIQFVLTQGKAIDWQIKAEAIKTYAKIFRDEAKDELLALFSYTDNYDIKSAVVGSFAFMENGMVYKELRDSISADVMKYNIKNPNKDGSMIGSPDLAKMYKAFVETLAELDNLLDAENKNIIRLIFSEFSASKNAAITDVCLNNLQDSMYLQYRGETCQIMTFDYQSFEYPKDKDVMIMYIQAWNAMKYDGAMDILKSNLKHKDYDIAKASADALKNITGKNHETEITAPKYRHDFDWNFIEKLSDKKIVNIKTNIGVIKIELFPETAPFTVQNFVKLSEKGFYNNTIFHRVVPNFVIQGGDPTGTGYGGPEYSIRSEFSPLSFDAYTVGMASSGKDTEGSQFFITHSPQPHLDGRYTLFGKVVDGFDVVDRIQIGDYIESISFSSN